MKERIDLVPKVNSRVHVQVSWQYCDSRIEGGFGSLELKEERMLNVAKKRKESLGTPDKKGGRKESVTLQKSTSHTYFFKRGYSVYSRKSLNYKTGRRKKEKRG